MFKNNDRQKETHPEYKGDILIGGVEYWLGAWVKEGKNGKFFSISATPKKKDGAYQPGPSKPSRDDDKDSIPF